MEYVLGPPVIEQNGGAVVRLGEDARRCVVYLGYGDGSDDGIDPIGTGFLVVHSGTGTVYLVTAQHVAHDLGHDPFLIRVNERGGLGRNIHMDNVEWRHHPAGECVDVSLMEFRPPEWADVSVFPTKSFLTEKKLEEKQTSAGDLAYVVGLFALLHGKRRNLPVVHTGHIALFPRDEPIPVYAWKEPLEDPAGERRIIYVNGYLVEAETLPGSSGSPVFVRRSVETSGIELNPQQFGEAVSAVLGSPSSLPGRGIEKWVYGSRWLLGVWQGSWGDDAGKMISLPGGTTSKSLRIGVVTPAIRILEILDMPDLQERRRVAQTAKDRKRAVSPQSARSTKAGNPSHKEDFNRLLDAAVKGQKSDG